MENLRLHFTHRSQTDRPLTTGVHRVVREASGQISVGDHAQGALMARICADRRGLWLQVATGTRGIHVNGRPVQRMALLRAGDSIYVDGMELLVQASPLPVERMPEPGSSPAPDPRIVLRGVGGKYHGRSVSLARPCLVGRAREAGIRIDDPVFAERHAQLELHGDRVLLRDLGSAEGSLVNGVAVRNALLVAGDQLVFDPQHRFVVEVPWAATAVTEPPAYDDALPQEPLATTPRSMTGGTVSRWPWLLLAALLLAAALSALLLFGAG